MRQLALELSARPEPVFANFVPGSNAELVAALQAIVDGRGDERFVYIWGKGGSGRSHLLRAAVAASKMLGREARYVAVPADAAALAHVATDALLAVDDVERLDAAGQVELFGLYNRLREARGALIASGAGAPAGLALRADLATRLGWGLVYEARALSDEEKAQAMSARAQARGFDLPAEVRDYALNHGRRDLPFLLALVDMLDRHTLETHRAVTLPLVRDLLKSETNAGG